MRTSALLLSLLLAAAVSAQPRHLETVEAALGGVVAAGETYDGLWTAEPGAALRVGAAFYGGQAHAALHAFPNHPQAPDLPAFRTLRGEVGWGPVLALPAGLRLTAGAAAGAMVMWFDDHDGQFVGALQNETELTAGLFARLDAPLAGPVRVFAGADVTRVYTAEPLVLRFVQGGVAVAVPSPGWLRRLLR
jgi:hypothetical protein